jgi:PTS system mannose-specific IIC component
MEVHMFTALILALWAYLCIIDVLGPTMFLGFRPLIAGFGTGILIGDVQTGMMVGATLELMALGVYTYGGATIPDYTVGAILGTYFGKSLGFEGGLALAIPAALLLTQVDVLGRFLNFVFVHKADQYAEQGDAAGFERMMVLFSHMIWGFSRAIPVFLAVAFGQPLVEAVSGFFTANPWFMNALKVVGGVLPALGFGMLLKILPVEKYPAFLLIGFVLYAYLKVPLLGIALTGLAIALIYHQVRYVAKEA